MKIAVSTRENKVDDHFGHCESYTIFEVNEMGVIVDTEILPSPNGCGCQSNIAAILHEKEVQVLLAGNMGNGAYGHLNNLEIRVYRGCSGDVRQLAEAYIQGNIIDSGSACQHHEHEDGHQCNHGNAIVK
jgi:predicted Fe-Mo cluster-binding NifX family protein